MLICTRGKFELLIGNTLFINIDHPDFKERVEADSKGRVRFGSRLASYLSNELASHYRMKIYKKVTKLAVSYFKRFS